ncbi:protein-export membrane protein SecD [Candidatus Giovannonibacteria bacterium RIFCSPHIGHO2_02_42_15]|uniref:Protein translocase subunit SecD n=2 Tax=Candidatus Giovannoniibacteriota TaxID=1752738 RepID=A0A1F5VR56_9BACT|nr:MAG: Preprotein translocase subunit SecD [Candidatus Giovannonibacteria bacterium GW2011_GWF2_42_19]OGF65541.1 MAG: protein-export membrane protein SecD [Candidatus Giovannonibacteria bacterium RIFCSPHIGHO2_02_42_15]
MFKSRILAIGFLILGLLAGYFDVANLAGKLKAPDFIKVPFRLGLDLQGGTHLTYKADVSQIDSSETSEAMSGLRDVIERRVNFFGVTEPLIQVEKRGDENRLIVELAGIKDINEAINMIGRTPYLEFKVLAPGTNLDELQKKQEAGDQFAILNAFTPTALTGRYIKKATLNTTDRSFEPVVSLQFNDEGRELFAEITRNNIERPVGIFLDGLPISTPIVREEITQGEAQISGNFTVESARELVRNINAGALPVPISLISQQSVGATLGESALLKMLWAGIYGTLAVTLFLIIFYRLPGFTAVVALAIYAAVLLMLFKLFPVTLTAAGIAGFILSIGMAVDANVLIFERTKEELRSGKSLALAVEEGFLRAWLSIRDSNVSSLITATILYWFGTSLVKGFALTLGLGILISMFSAITVTRTFLRAIEFKTAGEKSKIVGLLFGAKSLTMKHEA